MNHSRGEVVDVLFPFADLAQVKRRPALVIQSDRVRFDRHLIVACISSNLNKANHVRLFIPAASPAGLACGLKLDSVVLLDKLASVDEGVVYGRRGQLPEPELALVDACLKNILSLA